jgi:hypothetical protein
VTAPLKTIALFGEGIFAKSAVVTRQRRLNCYLEQRVDGDKSKIVCYGTPGMKFAFNPSTPQNQPARGMIGNDGALYEVAGNLLLSLSSAGATLASAPIGTSVGLVGMALNPTQVMVVDGSAGYVFTPATSAIVTAGGSFPNGARTITYCNGFGIAEQPGSNTFWVSALNDFTNWPGLSFAAAVQAIDGIVATDTVGGLLVIFSSGHIEFWQNVGAAQEPFVYITNSAVMTGIEAVNSRVHCGDDLLFLAHRGGGSFQNSAGSFHIARIRGYQMKPVSTSDIDNILQSMARTSTIQDCTAFSYEQDEHHMAQFNFPTANRSLLFDNTTGLWSEVQSGVTQGAAARHIGNLGCGAYDQQYIADYANGNVYTPDPTTYTDNGNVILREVVTRTTLDDFNTLRVGQLYLDMQTGVGLPNPLAQGYNPQVSLAIARDGQDFGPERLVALGKQGQYTQRVQIRRCGRARTFTLRIRMTDPVPFVITRGAVRVRSRVKSQAAARGLG